MPFYNGEKWACYSCTKGHRSSKCQHVDRILYKVRKPGRPLNNCPHTLPDMIQPGSFVNTSAESIALGNPPKEGGCKCSGEMVEVAIPKVKNCSCITAPTTGTPPIPPSKNGDSNGVKSGRVAKKTQARRKKSTVNGDALEAATTESMANGAATSEPSSTLQTPNFEVDSPVGVPPPYTPDGITAQIPYPSGVNGDHFQTPPVNGLSSAIPQGMVMSNSTSMMALQHSAPQQQFLQPIPTNRQLQYLADQEGKSNFEQMAAPPLSAHPVYFPDYSKQTSSSMPAPNGFPNGHHKQAEMPSFPQAMPNLNHMHEDRVFVSLSHHEYLWIKAARTAGVDFTQTPKFDSSVFPKIHQVQPQFSAPQPSPHTLSGPASEPISTLQQSSFPANASTSTCCNSTSAAPSPDIDASTGPSSPRCKCGDACRCVPCAEHPKNPVQVERIRGELSLLYSSSLASSASQAPLGGPKKSCCGSKQSPAEQQNSPSFDHEYVDKESPAVSENGSMGGTAVMADFSNFVLFNYNYGGEGCMEGQGGCMCGEGCTCVGCLTHGGHDGVQLEILGQEEAMNGAADGGQVNGDSTGGGGGSGNSGGGCCGGGRKGDEEGEQRQKHQQENVAKNGGLD